jgi:FkbM family methyltransferase
MLWRALKDVSNGFYIDVGAMSPDEHSVTKLFYERGWTGINVEPNIGFYKLLNEKRPLDVNLQLAVGVADGLGLISIIPNSGLSTMDDKIAAKHAKNLWPIEKQEVEVLSLASIWEKYVPPSRDVHFLKVDVEGFEEEVLLGNNWVDNRPWVVVVEATQPLTQIESHQKWEPTLIDNGYLFAYWDGLNRFYVDSRLSHLRGTFRYPPNVFDDYVPSQLIDAESRLQVCRFLVQDAEVRVQDAEVRVQDAEVRVQEAEIRVQEAGKVILDILNSTSWRFTAPLRQISMTIRSFADFFSTTIRKKKLGEPFIGENLNQEFVGSVASTFHPATSASLGGEMGASNLSPYTKEIESRFNILNSRD